MVVVSVSPFLGVVPCFVVVVVVCFFVVVVVCFFVVVVCFVVVVVVCFFVVVFCFFVVFGCLVVIDLTRLFGRAVVIEFFFFPYNA